MRCCRHDRRRASVIAGRVAEPLCRCCRTAGRRKIALCRWLCRLLVCGLGPAARLA